MVATLASAAFEGCLSPSLKSMTSHIQAFWNGKSKIMAVGS